MGPADEVLCQRVAGGDRDAFDLLVTRWQQRAWRVAWSVLRHDEDARDVSQEAFVRLWRSAGSFDARARFSTWFYRIVVNLCLDHRRRHRWWRRLAPGGPASDAAEGDPVDLQPAEASDPLETLGRERAMKRLWQAVDTLPPQQRAALTLAVQEELPTSEIAEALRCSEATVRVHLHRALANLRKRVERD